MTNERTKKITKKSKTSSPKPRTQKIWLVIIPIIIIAIAVTILLVVIQNRPTKLAAAYNECAKLFDAEIEDINSKVDATIYFKPGTSKETLESIADIIWADGNVKSIETFTSEDEYQKFLSENSDNEETASILDEEMKEIIISKMQAIMRIKVYDANDYSGIKKIISDSKDIIDNLDNEWKPSYGEPLNINFGTIELLDNGKTLVMEIQSGDYSDKISCACSVLGMPDRIKDSIAHTTALEGTKQSSWDDLNIEWYYRDKTFHIVIYQK